MSTGLALIVGIMKVVHCTQGDCMMPGLLLTDFLQVAFGLHPFLGALLLVSQGVHPNCDKIHRNTGPRSDVLGCKEQDRHTV
jgi:hypothetical protein